MSAEFRKSPNIDKKFGVVGAGFWSSVQTAAWLELRGVKPFAVCDTNIERARKLAEKYSIPKTYVSAEAMFANETLDFVDIITPPETHERLVLSAIEHNIPVICQKPMSTSLESAENMVKKSKEKNATFFVHENWRWQRPIRKLKEVIDSGSIGDIFRSRIVYSNNFPVFENQPFLKDLDQFMLTDMGTHLLDTARFLFGEADSIYCTTSSISPGIKGEDTATVNLNMKNGSRCNIEMSYTTVEQKTTFPQTFILVEGNRGTLNLGIDYLITQAYKDKTIRRRYPPKQYSWTDPKYKLVQSSIVPANANFLKALNGGTEAETTGEDNLKTLRLVYAAYDSADRNEVIKLR